MKERSRKLKIALTLVLFSVFGVLNVNAATVTPFEMKLQKVSGLGITTKAKDSMTSVQSMAITRNHFVFVMTNTNDETSNNILYVMDKNSKAFVRQVEIDSCGQGNGITYNENDNTLVIADGAHKRLVVYNADSFTKVKEIGTGDVEFNNIAYDKDRNTYYLAPAKGTVIARYNGNFIKLSNLNVESYDVKGGNYRINQDMGYYNGYIYLTNYVSSANMEASYSTGKYKATAGDAVIYTYNVVTGEKSKMFYNKAASDAALDSCKELEGIDFIGETPYLLFQKGGTFQVYTTSSIKSGMAVKDDGKNYVKSCEDAKVGPDYGVKVLYDTNSNKIATGNLKLMAETNGKELVIIDYNEGEYGDDGKYKELTASGHASSLKDPDIIGRRIDYKGTYLSINADAEHKGIVLRLKLANGKTDDKCMSHSDYEASNNKNKKTIYNYVYVEIIDLTQNQPKEQKNEHYDTICRVIRLGENYKGNYTRLASIWDAQAAAEGGNYRVLFPYCFEQYTQTPYNNENNVVSAMTYVMEAYNTSKMNNIDRSKLESQSFLNAFEKSEARAKEQNHYYNESQTTDAAKNKKTLSCKHDTIREKTENGEYIYDSKNTQSYFGTDLKDVFVNYVYHYDSNHTAETNNKVCTRACYEAVDVEYGAPEAAVAGFAIQYQVKLTSRVRCEAKIDIDNPIKPSICQPQPACVHANNWTITQGGPAEDYDACIMSCDGGKYTQKCSKSCYNKVYGNNSKTKKTADDTTTGKAQQVKVSLAQMSGGYYDRDAAGNIFWNGGWGTYAQWYFDHGEIQADEDVRNGGSFFTFSGFKKLGNSKYEDICDSNCSHINCEPDTYLKQENIEEDYVRNLEKYNEAVKSCQATAVCTTKQSTYSMQADYKQKEENGSIKEGHAYYPNEGNPNNSSSTCKLKSLSKTEDIQIKNGSDTVIKCYDGCYKSNEARNYYLSEITFPGTWVNNKTGEISYGTKRIEDGWHFDEGKFFIPLDSPGINTDYWRYYLDLKSSKVTVTSYSKEVIRNNCRDYTTYELKDTFKMKSSDSFDYNIKASVKDFGYFGWDFDVRCFYAVAEYEPEKVKAEQTITNCTPPEKDPYVIRTVAKEDLFPADSNESEGNTDKTKPNRITGFNWTEEAEIISKNHLGKIDVNHNYVNNPIKVLGDIQTRGIDIYGSDYKDTNSPEGNPYLDYAFYLTPSDLKQIKNYGSKNSHNYTDFTGNYEVISGVNAYYSGLIDELRKTNAVKKVGNPGCNNDNETERTCIFSESVRRRN